MADEFSSQTIVDMLENTTLHETDLFIIGENGEANLRKVTLSTILTLIRNRLTSWTLTVLNTTSKTLTGSINELAASLTNGSVTKIGTRDVGSGENPIYLNGGAPEASSATIGKDNAPVFMDGGTIKPCGFSIQHGAVSMTSSEEEVTNKAINFGTAFDAGVVPDVLITLVSTDPDAAKASVANITNTGFTLCFSGKSNATVDWIAIGEEDVDNG